MENWDFMFEDIESGERFFVECANMDECKRILYENDIAEEEIKFLGVFNTYEADILGYDTY